MHEGVTYMCWCVCQQLDSLQGLQGLLQSWEFWPLASLSEPQLQTSVVVSIESHQTHVLLHETNVPRSVPLWRHASHTFSRQARSEEPTFSNLFPKLLCMEYCIRECRWTLAEARKPCLNQNQMQKTNMCDSGGWSLQLAILCLHIFGGILHCEFYLQDFSTLICRTYVVRITFIHADWQGHSTCYQMIFLCSSFWFASLGTAGYLLAMAARRMMHFVMLLPGTRETRIEMSQSWRLRQSACRTVAIETSMKSSVQTWTAFLSVITSRLWHACKSAYVSTISILYSTNRFTNKMIWYKMIWYNFLWFNMI